MQTQQQMQIRNKQKPVVFMMNRCDADIMLRTAFDQLMPSAVWQLLSSTGGNDCIECSLSLTCLVDVSN